MYLYTFKHLNNSNYITLTLSCTEKRLLMCQYLGIVHFNFNISCIDI